MARSLAKSTVDRLRKRLVEEKDRLTGIIREMDEDREEIRLSETSSDRSPDPNTAEGEALQPGRDLPNHHKDQDDCSDGNEGDHRSPALEQRERRSWILDQPELQESVDQRDRPVR